MIRKRFKRWILCGVLLLGMAMTQMAFSQNPLQFTSVRATEEGAIRLAWESNTNEVYRIEYASELVDNTTGITSWQPLCEDYPSHGTNTFWLDTGNNASDPILQHPKNSTVRFYRILLTGTGQANPPTVALTFPTNNSVVSGDLTVTAIATSEQPELQTILYVDGEEMPDSDDGTNFVINTCEWANGVHTLFAVAKSQSGLEGAANDRSVTCGYAVSSYVNVMFANLITKVAFSEPFFEPALGQTQKVSAAFAANANWTLQIQNEATNTVRFASGNGASMLFNWDGTGTNGVSLPDGVYTYLITAQTNGQALLAFAQQSDSETAVSDLNSVATDEFRHPKSTKQALAAGMTSYCVRRPPLPPVKTNGTWIPWETIYDAPVFIEVPVASSLQQKTLLSAALSFDSGAGNEQADNYAGSNTQSTRTPIRPPNSPMKNPVGTFGVCYMDYMTNGFNTRPPRTGWPWPLQQYVAVDGHSASVNVDDASVPSFKDVAKGFKRAMERKGWKGWVKANDDWEASDIMATAMDGQSIFNTVNVGLLCTHGSYATTAETDGIRHTYFYLFNKQYQYSSNVKIDHCDFGSPGTNGLRWMALLACNMLRDANYQDLYNNWRLPINNDLHLLLGCATTAYSTPRFGKNWGKNMTGTIFRPPDTIQESWFNAGRKSYEGSTTIAAPIVFRVAGWPNCFNDTLKNYAPPDSGDPYNITYVDQQVYP